MHCDEKPDCRYVTSSWLDFLLAWKSADPLREQLAREDETRFR